VVKMLAGTNRPLPPRASPRPNQNAREGYARNYRFPPAARHLSRADRELFNALEKRQIALGDAQPALSLRSNLPQSKCLPPSPGVGLHGSRGYRGHERVLQEIRRSPPLRHHRPAQSYACPRLIEQRIEVIERLMSGADPQTRKHHEMLISVVRRLGEQNISITDGMQSDAMRLLSSNGGHVGQTIKALKRGLRSSRASTELVIEYKQDLVDDDRGQVNDHHAGFDDEAGDPETRPATALLFRQDVTVSPYIRRQQHLRSMRGSARDRDGFDHRRPTTSPVRFRTTRGTSYGFGEGESAVFAALLPQLRTEPRGIWRAETPR